MLPLGGTVLPKCKYLTHAPRRLTTKFVVQPVDWRDRFIDDPELGEQWADNESAKYGGRDSQWWRQNMEMELVRSGAPRWGMLSKAIHIRVIPYAELVGKSWACYRSFDYGIRHPSCCAWFAVNGRGDRYFYRQYYRTGADVATLVKEMTDQTPIEERIVYTVCDPSVWRRQSHDLTLLADLFAQYGFPMVPADNGQQGYETVGAGFMSAIARYAMARGDLDFVRRALNTPELTIGTVERLAEQPAIWFSPECARGAMSLYEQCANLRYREQRGDPAHRAAPVAVEDVDDEGPDVVRYATHTPGVQYTTNKPAINRKERMIRDIWADQEQESRGQPRNGAFP